MTKPPWAVSKAVFLAIDGGLGCLVAVVAVLVDHFSGLVPAIVVALVFPFLLPFRTQIFETHEERRRRNSLIVEALSQAEFDSLENPDDNTLRVIVPKKPTT